MNYYVLLVFSPLLIFIGVVSFLIPKDKALTSGAPAYNIFHIISGFVGMACVISQNDTLVRGFNIGFGALDLYQAAASYLHLFPAKYFKWKQADDVLHIVIGLLLVLVGIFG